MRNWAGTYEYTARTLHEPRTLEELQETVANASRIRVLGSKHSFTAIADAEELVTLEHLPRTITYGEGTVTVPAAMRYGELATDLDANGRALHNLASLPHISVAGAVVTATHGSGTANLATAVTQLELVTADGELRTHTDPVTLGALGAVTTVTLRTEPYYEVRQAVYEGLSWEALQREFDAITQAAYSVSLFTLWDDFSVWLKSRNDLPDAVADARPADGERHPIPGLDPVRCTRQQGVPGPWNDRLPHFQMGFTPSAGEEIQSEYLVPREHALPALEAVRRLGPALRPHLQVSEIRTIGEDDLWLSPQHDRDTIGIHFTWKREPETVARLAAAVELSLSPYGARPHWGKFFVAGSATIADRYPRLPDFLKLAAGLDPAGKFRNAWFERHVG